MAVKPTFLIQRFERHLWSLGYIPQFSSNAIKGRYGEWMAEKKLIAKNYEFLTRNWRSKRDRRMEIDLIFKNNGIYVFVEVRTRNVNSLVNGYESFCTQKRKSVSRSIKLYLAENVTIINHYRLDLIEVDLCNSNKQKPVIFHYENIAISS